MHYDRAVFMSSVPIVDKFVKHLVLHRALRIRLEPEQLALSVWSLSSDAHLLQAVICWCKVFGRDSNRTHWWHLSARARGKLQRSFRKGLPTATGRTIQEWETYHKEVLHFRNKYAAHTELVAYNRPVPDFTFALSVAFYWDGWVRTVIAPDVLNERPLRELTTAYEVVVQDELCEILGR